MTDLTLKNLLAYAILWALNGLVVCLAAAIAAGALWGFGEGGFFEPIRAGVGAALGLIGTALAMWLAANRPRLGREDISSLVSEVGHLNAKGVLVNFLHGGQVVAPLSDDEFQRMARLIVDEIRDRMEAPAEPHTMPAGSTVPAETVRTMGLLWGNSARLPTAESGLLSQPPRYMNPNERPARERTV